ncbi:MAG: hypothetical protein KA179_06770 [Sulfuritalea sp.]|nr:hypothetical protein [Sulfuritalea sp.]
MQAKSRLAPAFCFLFFIETLLPCLATATFPADLLARLTTHRLWITLNLALADQRHYGGGYRLANIVRAALAQRAHVGIRCLYRSNHGIDFSRIFRRYRGPGSCRDHCCCKHNR